MSDPFAEMTQRKADHAYVGDMSPARFRMDGVKEDTPLEEAQLLSDRKFIEYSKVMYGLMQGEPFTGDDEEAGRYGINLIGEFNYNFAQPLSGEVAGVELRPGTLAQAARLIASGSKDNATKWVYMMDQYERLPNFTLSGSWRMARGMLMDPSTWGAAIFTGGGGFVARKAGLEATSVALKNLAIGLTTKKSLAAGGAIYTGVPAAIEPIVQEQAGFTPPPETALEVLGSTAIGAAAGPAIAKTAEVAAPVVKQIIEAVSPSVEGNP
jgi:hypothetical protein